jgi:hypothetical protein
METEQDTFLDSQLILNKWSLQFSCEKLEKIQFAEKTVLKTVLKLILYKSQNGHIFGWSVAFKQVAL